MTGCHCGAFADDADDIRANVFHRHTQRQQYSPGDPFLDIEQAEEDVLGPDVVVPELARLSLGFDYHLPRTIREPLEHSGEDTPRRHDSIVHIRGGPSRSHHSPTTRSPKRS